MFQARQGDVLVMATTAIPLTAVKQERCVLALGEVTGHVENLYFWHGVLVPAFVVVKPEWITVQHIETESNAEVRRVWQL